MLDARDGGGYNGMMARVSTGDGGMAVGVGNIGGQISRQNQNSHDHI
jgi:hypothetical protein